MEQLLYWLEPKEKWQSRGYANNQFLRVNYDCRTYTLETGYWIPKGSDNEIEVYSKGELKKYVGYLDKNNFNKNLT